MEIGEKRKLRASGVVVKVVDREAMTDTVRVRAYGQESDWITAAELERISEAVKE